MMFIPDFKRDKETDLAISPDNYSKFHIQKMVYRPLKYIH